MDDTDKQIGLRLKVARKAVGYKTAIEFSHKTKIPKSTYSQHENGKRSLTAYQLLNYAEILDVTPNWLLTGLGHPCPISRDKARRKELIELAVADLQKERKLPISKNLQISIDDSYVVVNMELFIKILTTAIKAVSMNNPEVQANELVNFCIEIYNNVEFIITEEEEKSKIIHLSINSMLRGNKIFQKNLPEKKSTENL